MRRRYAMKWESDRVGGCHLAAENGRRKMEVRIVVDRIEREGNRRGGDDEQWVTLQETWNDLQLHTFGKKIIVDRGRDRKQEVGSGAIVEWQQQHDSRSKRGESFDGRDPGELRRRELSSRRRRDTKEFWNSEKGRAQTEEARETNLDLSLGLKAHDEDHEDDPKFSMASTSGDGTGMKPSESETRKRKSSTANLEMRV
ncbi:hypothetical protein KSP40_PGU008404 [Platanthera guangdongensis]|uniref:Uncharacterized protein n=1 Tax=Platanthera guangdongensis TaxID=2320717 RepID=A0ABR2LPN4_9ASPA